MSETPAVLTIDGPSGSGKGTVSQMIADRLGWRYLDSGALYRITALAAHDCSLDITDTHAVAALARRLDVSFLLRPGGVAEVLLDGVSIGERLRTEEIGNLASQIAAITEVREALIKRQRDFLAPPGLVADGRDMGTRIFPGATLKIFLTASADERAKRRYKQLKEKGFDVNLPRLLGEIRERDARDMARAASPLRAAADAVEIDSSALSINEVVERILALLAARLDHAE